MTGSREDLPAGRELEEYVKELIARMPTSTLTHRETWAIKKYIEKLQHTIRFYREN